MLQLVFDSFGHLDFSSCGKHVLHVYRTYKQWPKPNPMAPQSLNQTLNKITAGIAGKVIFCYCIWTCACIILIMKDLYAYKFMLKRLSNTTWWCFSNIWSFIFFEFVKGSVRSSSSCLTRCRLDYGAAFGESCRQYTTGRHSMLSKWNRLSDWQMCTDSFNAPQSIYWYVFSCMHLWFCLSTSHSV